MSSKKRVINVENEDTSKGLVKRKREVENGGVRRSVATTIDVVLEWLNDLRSS